jgi:ParB-like chromosome segregation protein Spo0J
MTTPTLEPHPLSKLFPPISEEDFGKLAADIKLHGLRQHIVLYQGKILDGNNRYRACSLAGIKPTFADFTGIDADARNYVISANIHRRHLDRETRTKIVTELLRADPTQSNRRIAETAKVDDKTVGAVREKLEATAEIPQLESTTGADGKTRKRKGKPKSGSGSKGKAITFQEVVDGKTARYAYYVLEEHLLDALQEINDRSSFDYADEYAQATIEKLQGERCSRKSKKRQLGTMGDCVDAFRRRQNEAQMRLLRRNVPASCAEPTLLPTVVPQQRQGGRRQGSEACVA